MTGSHMRNGGSRVCGKAVFEAEQTGMCGEGGVRQQLLAKPWCRLHKRDRLTLECAVGTWDALLYRSDVQ